MIPGFTPPVVCIDPGHPSEVGRGTHGRRLTEIHANWVMAVALEDRLRKDGIVVILTKRSEGQFVSNRERAETANRAKATLMIRLHCDGSPTSGYAVYYPALQGRDGKVTGPSEKVIRQSRAAAQAFYDAFSRSLGSSLKDNGLRTDRETSVGKKHGALIGSIYSERPILLVEMLTLTNEHDEAYLSSRRGKEELAQSLEKGVLGAIRAVEPDPK